METRETREARPLSREGLRRLSHSRSRSHARSPTCLLRHMSSVDGSTTQRSSHVASPRVEAIKLTFRGI